MSTEEWEGGWIGGQEASATPFISDLGKPL